MILHYGCHRFYFDIITYKKILPDEIYNLAAQSHVAVSFEAIEYTANADALGCLRILEAIDPTSFNQKQDFIKLELLKCMEK